MTWKLKSTAAVMRIRNLGLEMTVEDVEERLQNDEQFREDFGYQYIHDIDINLNN